MEANYDLTLIAVSFCVMAVAAYGALDLSARGVVFERQRRRLWLFVSAFAFGTGIWASHLVWLLGSRLPLQLSFDPTVTFVSWAAAVNAALLGLHMIQRRSIDSAALAAGGALIGVSLCVLHYAAMFALGVMPRISYDSELFSASVFVAMGASAASLMGGFTVQNSNAGRTVPIKLCAAVLIALAVCGVFHTATVAAHIPAGAICSPDNALHGDHMALPAVLIAVGLMALALLSSSIDAHMVVQNRRAARDRGKSMVGNPVA